MKVLQFCRYFIVSASIFLLISIIIFFSISPLFFSIDFDQSILVVKQTTPVFLGYLGQCCYYVISDKAPDLPLDEKKSGFLIILTVFPFIVFSVSFVAVSCVFFISNVASAAPGTGMAFSRFTDWMSILLGVFAATASILTAWLFRGQGK